MNLIAMIGVVDTVIKSSSKDSQLYIKVERPFAESKGLDDIYELFKVNLNSTIFKNDIDILEKGALVGLKGRMKNTDDNLQIIAERIQIF